MEVPWTLDLTSQAKQVNNTLGKYLTLITFPRRATYSDDGKDKPSEMIENARNGYICEYTAMLPF